MQHSWWVFEYVPIEDIVRMHPTAQVIIMSITAYSLPVLLSNYMRVWCYLIDVGRLAAFQSLLSMLSIHHIGSRSSQLSSFKLILKA